MNLQMRWIRSLAGALVLATALVASAAGGPLEEGMDAYRAKEYAKAVELWRPLADKGDAVAQYRLGTLYAEGKGVEQNDATAFMWMQRAAIQGNADAQYDMGASYFAGIGVEKSETEAAKWFQRAANQGVAFAQLNLGLLYAAGNGVPQDNIEAFKWLQIAFRGLPPGGPRMDVAKAMQDVAAKLRWDELDEARARERAWTAHPEVK
jgi:TPR repeat protein